MKYMHGHLTHANIWFYLSHTNGNKTMLDIRNSATVALYANMDSRLVHALFNYTRHGYARVNVISQ